MELLTVQVLVDDNLKSVIRNENIASILDLCIRLSGSNLNLTGHLTVDMGI